MNPKSGLPLVLLLLLSFAGCLAPRPKPISTRLGLDKISDLFSMQEPTGASAGGHSSAQSSYHRTAAQTLWPTELLPAFAGQYTYILLADDRTFPAAEAEKIRARNLQLLRVVLALPETATALAVIHDPHAINQVLIPIDLAKLSPEVLATADASTDPLGARVDLVYRAYDFLTASLVIDRIRQTSTSAGVLTQGPVFYSSHLPLIRSDPRPLPRFVSQDMSKVPDTVVYSWWRYFLQKTSKADYWNDDPGRVAIKLREYAESLGASLEPTQGAFTSLATFFGFKGEGGGD